MATSVFEGTSSKKLATLNVGKLYQGTSSTQIGKIDGQAGEPEIIAILNFVMGLF
jgi:hypothetical protein